MKLDTIATVVDILNIADVGDFDDDLATLDDAQLAALAESLTTVDTG